MQSFLPNPIMSEGGGGKAKTTKYEAAMLKMAEASSAMVECMSHKGSSKGSKGGGKGKGSSKGGAVPSGLKPDQHPTGGQWLCLNHVCQWAIQTHQEAKGAETRNAACSKETQ